MKRRDVLLIAAALALNANGFSADKLAWGPAVNDLRLGIGIGPASPEPELRVLLQNTGSRPLDVLIGSEIATGTILEFKFIAIAPDGKERKCFDVNSLTPVAGLVLPLVAHVEPGASHESRFPLNRIICVQNRTQITFDHLLKRGYSLRVSFETDAEGARWLTDAWTGKVVSVNSAIPD